MTRWASLCALLLLGTAASASAQSIPAPPAPALTRGSPPAAVETTTPAWVLMDLPSNGSLYSVLETIQPDMVSNRIEGGGLYAGTAAHIGAHGSTWTQTLFRVGDINLSDPDGSGTPLAIPGVLELERIDVNSGIMGVDVNAPGLVVNLTPRRPSSTWIRRDRSGVRTVRLAGGEQRPHATGDRTPQFVRERHRPPQRPSSRAPWRRLRRHIPWRDEVRARRHDGAARRDDLRLCAPGLHEVAAR